MVNIFGEFEDVESQLKNVEEHLNNMVMKNIAFEYVGDVFDNGSHICSNFELYLLSTMSPVFVTLGRS